MVQCDADTRHRGAVEAVEPVEAGPFRRLDSDAPARVVLHQVTAREFELVEGFRYDGQAGSYEVRPEDLPDTDLASIPRVLGWFASSYGRHTLAALLHDHLVRNGRQLRPPVRRHHADEVFRDSLDELGVPYLRSRIMWTAVVFATRWKHRLHAVAMLLWTLGALAGISALVVGAVRADPVLMAAALAAPVPAALLWGREARAGVLGGYLLWFMLAPTVVAFVFYSVYAVAEALTRLLRWRRPRPGFPRPSGPPSFRDR